MTDVTTSVVTPFVHALVLPSHAKFVRRAVRRLAANRHHTAKVLTILRAASRSVCADFARLVHRKSVQKLHFTGLGSSEIPREGRRLYSLVLQLPQ